MPRKRPYDPIGTLVTDEDIADVRAGRSCAAIDRVIARIKQESGALRGERHALVASARTFYPPGHPQHAAWQAELDELAA
ncbi:MAG: hypothetical protein Q7S02_04615 [bacterium]|nr:hypothetical protein [bacterium]